MNKVEEEEAEETRKGKHGSKEAGEAVNEVRKEEGGRRRKGSAGAVAGE